MNTVSLEFIEAREDEIATILTAIDEVDDVRHLLRLLYKNGAMEEVVYRMAQQQLSDVEAALHISKRNTAALRNGGAR